MLGTMLIKIVNKKKKDAIYAKYSAQFPPIDNCVDMTNQIAAANVKLAELTKTFYDIKGIHIAKKNQAKRERDALRDVITDMNNYLKDLQCGISTPASASTVGSVAAQPSMNLQVPQQFLASTNNSEPATTTGQTPPVQNQTTGGNSTSPVPAPASKKKLLLYAGIGGVVLLITGIIIYKNRN